MESSKQSLIATLIVPAFGHSRHDHQPLRTFRKLMRLCTVSAAAVLVTACGGLDSSSSNPIQAASATNLAQAGSAPDPALVAQGKQIFRFDTFGDETQWSDTLRMHEVIAAAVDPTTALSVGLKVDAEALPAAVVQGIQNGDMASLVKWSKRAPATVEHLLRQQ